MVDRIFKTILLFTPIAYCVGVNYYKFEVIFFQVTSMVLIASSLFDTPKRQFKVKKLLTLFFGICLFSTVVNGCSSKSVVALVSIFLGCMSIYILTVYVKDIRKCFDWLLIGVGLNTLVWVGQMLGFHPFIKEGMSGTEYGGIIGNSPRFATCLALIVPFVKKYYLIPLMILAYYLTEVVLPFSIFFVLIYHYRRNKKVMTILIMLGVLGLGYDHKGIIGSGSSRAVIFWKPLITQLAQRPLFGYGVGAFDIIKPGYSSFAQWIYGVGFLGLGFIILCLRKIKWYLLPLVFLCLVEYPFEIPRLWPVIIFTIAYYAIEQKEDILWD